MESKKITHSVSQGLTAHDVMTMVQYAINRLEDASKEDQKSVFENVIQFAQFYPQKLRPRVLCGADSLFVGSTAIKNGGEDFNNY